MSVRLVSSVVLLDPLVVPPVLAAASNAGIFSGSMAEGSGRALSGTAASSSVFAPPLRAAQPGTPPRVDRADVLIDTVVEVGPW